MLFEEPVQSSISGVKTMRIRIISVLCLVILTIGVTILSTTTLQAQSVSFVHITDPHLFDPGNEGTQNRFALAACIKALNARMDAKADYKFAVITGDIGIENLVSHITDPNSKKRELEDAATQERNLEDGANQLASILAPAKIQLWLFVPGNNDLFDEQPDLQYYQRFLEKLKNKLPGFKIEDLCKQDGNQNTYSIDGFTLIGFNNASFKNNNDPCRRRDNQTKQSGYVEQVVKRVGLNASPALIFYHIPEVDDPHIVLNADTGTPGKRKALCADSSPPTKPRTAKNQKRKATNLATPAAVTTTDVGPYPDSSWFVDPQVIQAWKEKVVKNKKVLGLFAGHLHDWRRENYSGSLSKLYICPPLAVKLQDVPSQARGFQEVTTDAAGRITRTVFWFNSADATFDTDPSSRSNELALAMFYETNGQWQQAESHFSEALKSAPSSYVRNEALEGMTRAHAAQFPRVKKIFAWIDPVFLATYVLRPLALLAILVFIFIGVIAVCDGFDSIVIHEFEGDEELAKAIAVRFPAVQAKVTKLLNSPDRVFLPLNAQTPFPVVAPRVKEFFPAEAFELAGVKVPNLNVLLRWIVRPRFQVTGGFSPDGDISLVHAEVWRRKDNWFGLRRIASITRNIPKGRRRSREIENLIYEIYLTANASNTEQDA
jgi:hypothetical protein